MPNSGPRTWIVNQRHPTASDSNKGSTQRPFLTINAASQLARPGDTVIVHAGIYRERVSPARGGEAGKPITYAAASGEKVYLRGSEVFAPKWKPLEGAPAFSVDRWPV